MLDVRRLRLLVELKRRGTITAVARALAYSPSSVSEQLSILEDEAGVALLTPAGRRLQFTPQGELLLEHARAVLDRLELAEADLAQSLRTVGGTVRLVTFQSAALALVPRALTFLRREHPLLRIEVTEREPEEGIADVASREADLVIAEQYPGRTRAHHAELDRIPVGGDRIRLALPAGASGLAAAAELPWVLEPVGSASRQWAVQVCRAAGFDPDIRFSSADLMAHIRLIRAGHAVGLLPDLVWAGETPDVGLETLPGNPHREIFTSTRRPASVRPAVVALREALARASDEMTGETAG